MTSTCEFVRLATSVLTTSELYHLKWRFEWALIEGRGSLTMVFALENLCFELLRRA